MKKIFSFFAALLVAGGMMAGETEVYKLTPASGSNNQYAKNCDIDINDVTWNITGNSQQLPWRIGGKSLTAVDRTLYSKTAIESDICKIVVEHGEAKDIDVNSWKLEVASDAAFTNIISTLTPTFEAEKETSILRPDGADWSNAYYRFTYNVTVSSSSNKFMQFKGATFYTDGEAPAPKPSYYLVGTMNEWKGSDAYKLKVNSAAEGEEYQLNLTLAEGNADMKVIGVLGEDTTWYPVEKNFHINDRGYYTIYFRPNGNDAWGEYKYIFSENHTAINCVSANALAKDGIAYLNEVVVTYVNGAYIYVKDNSGAGLIYAYDFGLKAGDVVFGFIGKSDPYNGLPELKPEGVKLADLFVTAGEAPAPEELTTSPSTLDVHKYVSMKNVRFGVANFDEDNLIVANINEENFVVRNRFNLDITFDTEKTYDIIGTCAITVKDEVTTPQLYLISAVEHKDGTTALDDTNVEHKAVKSMKNGQLIIIKNGVRYNALGTAIR